MFRIAFHALLASGLLSLAGCELMAEKPAPEPPAPPPPVVEEVPPPPPAPAPVVLKPAPKPAPKAVPRAKPKTQKEKPKLIEETATAESAVDIPARAAPASAQEKKATPPVKGPEWLQYCIQRQQSSTGIQCDANSLLAEPSAKVRVYVREPSLVRGGIQLREGLPRLYRFFVIP